jgi:PTH2 family peptidyl-tRNA hydrolase
MSKIKQVIVMRIQYPDGKGGFFKLRTGKQIAQGAHASMKVILDTPQPYPAPMQEWLTTRFTKVVVQVNTEAELLEVYNKAKNAGLPCALIQDSGATEFHGVPTYTAVAIGPDLIEKIDPITLSLKLL